MGSDDDFVFVEGEPVAKDKDVEALESEVEQWKKKTKRWRVISFVLFILGLVLNQILELLAI